MAALKQMQLWCAPQEAVNKEKQAYVNAVSELRRLRITVSKHSGGEATDHSNAGTGLPVLRATPIATAIRPPLRAPRCLRSPAAQPCFDHALEKKHVVVCSYLRARAR